MRSITQRHERQQRPLILHCRVGSFRDAEPRLYLGSSVYGVSLVQPVQSKRMQNSQKAA
jgi:hypothetical protein